MFIEKILITNIFRNLENGSISWMETWIFEDGAKKVRFGKTFKNGRGLAYRTDLENFWQCEDTCNLVIKATTKTGIAREIRRMISREMAVNIRAALGGVGPHPKY